jgi:hypothetical protein
MSNSFHGSQFSWIRIFLTSFLFHHATFARQDTLLQVAANFLLDPQFPRVLSFLFWQWSMARLQTLHRFLGSPAGITAAFPFSIS